MPHSNLSKANFTGVLFFKVDLRFAVFHQTEFLKHQLFSNLFSDVKLSQQEKYEVGTIDGLAIEDVEFDDGTGELHSDLKVLERIFILNNR
jgi:uncharacterized protein YjbI with pentapeptide repeats